MKKLISFLLIFLSINFIFAEEYHFHGKDKNGTIRNISVIISEEGKDCVSGYYREECFLEKKKINIPFTALLENGKYTFEVKKNKKIKKIEFTADENELEYKATVTKSDGEDPLFIDFSCKLDSLSKLMKSSQMFILSPSTNETILNNFYKSKGDLTPYDDISLVPETISLNGKKIKIKNSNQKFYNVLINGEPFVYTFLYSKTENYTAYHTFIKLGKDPDDIQYYALQTLTFDTTPLVINTGKNLILIHMGLTDSFNSVKSDFYAQPCIFTGKDFSIPSHNDIFYFNISRFKSTEIEIVKTIPYQKSLIVENGFDISLEIFAEKNAKSGTKNVYNNFIVVMDNNDKEFLFKLLVFKNRDFAGYYNIPLPPEFDGNIIKFVMPGKRNKEEKPEEVTYDLKNELPKEMIIFGHTCPLIKPEK